MWVQYYDASSLVSAFGFLIIPLLFVLLGVYFLIGIKKGEVDTEKYPLFIMQIWTGGAVLIALFATILFTKGYISLMNIIKNKEYTEVEGYVEDFIQVTNTRIKTDSFTINNIRFSCGNSYGVSFDKTKAQGSPIYTGQYVKIHCFEGRILKLWVKNRK
jgi:hypothetical protein